MHSFLNNIIKNEQHHARWLNTLSFLEYIGTRKIIKSQRSQQLDIEILQHILEEARHALFFKNIVTKHFKINCKTYENKFLLGDNAAQTYFQELDHAINNYLDEHDSPPHLVYFYVTLVIERRALVLYQTYDHLLEKYKFKFRIKSIIKEEVGHLEDTEEFLQSNDTNFQQRANLFTQIEKKLYEDFISAIKQAIGIMPAREHIHVH